jgi:hypothetical protein
LRRSRSAVVAQIRKRADDDEVEAASGGGFISVA